MNEILQALRRCREQRRPCVVAVIVRVAGSAYRREGARCVVLPDGEIVGILSGGCVEEDIREHALAVLRDGAPRTVEYDLRAGADEPWGLGTGCNGAVTVWLERFDPASDPQAAEAMLKDLEARRRTETGFCAVTVIASDDPARIRPGLRRQIPCPASGELSAAALFGPDAAFALSGGMPGTAPAPSFEMLTGTAPALPLDSLPAAGIVPVRSGGRYIELFIEKVPPAPLLTVIGAGPDVDHLCRAAGMLEWRTRVAYHPTARAVKEHFPHADELVHVPRAEFGGLAERPHQYVVVMTHNLELDREAVRQLLPREEIVYLGVLGSRSRIAQILDYAGQFGPLAPEWLDKLHAPVGLDIGAATPQEIALSVMAEIVARRNGRSGGPMRDRRGMRPEGSLPDGSLSDGSLRAAPWPIESPQAAPPPTDSPQAAPTKDEEACALERT